MMRTDYCGAFRERDVGRAVAAAGWVQNKRDMGGVIFIDLKDREGTLQVVFDQQYLPDAIKNRVYYHPGENKNEQAAAAYWKRIKGR